MRRILPVLVLLVALVVGGRAVSNGQMRGGLDPSVRLLAEAMAKVEAGYVEPLESDTLARDAIRGMLSALDPYSVYLDPDDFTNLRIGTSGNYEGLGIQISIRNGFLTVIAPFEGTPADRAGIIAGDRIIEIDGETTEAMTLDDAVHRMRGPKGTSVVLKVARGHDRRLLDISVTRDVIELKSVPYAFRDPSGVGYVRVSSFSEHTGRDLRRAIDALEEQDIHGLILDLRGNPGGLLDQAVEVAECFVPAGKLIVETRGRARRDEHQYTSHSRRTYDDLPLVVMIDMGSASASEIVSGAIQDWDLGLVVGKTSFGKASVQTVLSLSDGSAIKLTTAKYYTPSGRSIQRDDHRREPKVTAGIDAQGHEERIEEGETYFTSMGREIHGRGGITPDIEIEPTEYPELLQDVARAGVLQEYVPDFIDRHPHWTGSSRLGDQERAVFGRMVREIGKLEPSEAELDEAWPAIERQIRREVARRTDSELAGWRIMLDGDAQYQKALELFREAPTLKAMFDLASGFKPAAGESAQ